MRGVAASGASGALKAPLPTARAIGKSIANAPDHGQLISYANKGEPTKREGAYTWYPIAISEAHAFRGLASGEMTVPTPEGGQVKVRYERHAEEIDGNWTWIGRVVGGDPLQEAIITFGEKAVFGSIPMGKGKLPLSLQTRQGQVFAVETDPSLVVSANTGHVDMLVAEASQLRAMAGATASQSAAVSQGAVAVAQGAPQTAANTIDVAIGYTPEFATDNGGASGAATRLVYLIQVGNQAFTNSQINGYLRIVNAVQVSYTNSTPNATALNEVTGSNGSAQVAVPPSLVPLRTARDQYGADIAILVRKFTTPENAGCGVAWLNGAGAQNGGVRASDAPFGYAVISDGYDQGTDGKTYYCAEETLVHEAGHLMGAAHDRANSKINPNNPPGGTNLLYGAYSYSFGLNTDAANGNFFTLDAYGDEAGGDTPYRVFSNPNVTICGGRACGVANSEDNARTLNQTIPVVAAFRATVLPLGKAANDFNGDGKSDIYWRNNQTGINHIWRLDGRVQTGWGHVYTEADKTWKVIGSGDFNADGKADVLWRNSTTGRLFIQHMDGYTVLSTSGSVDSLADLAWEVAAVADFDGNGTSDIMWRNVNDGRVTLWTMSGRAPTAAVQVYQERQVNWRIVAPGDFNGDGYPDLLWRNVATGENFILYMQGTSVAAGSGSITRVSEQQWQIVAVRDFNADGRDDIYWRNSASGQNALWLMNGLQVGTLSYVYIEPSAAWKIVNSGDYNGDGRADLFWRNTSTGQNFVQLYDGTQVLATSGYTTQVADQAWQVTGR